MLLDEISFYLQTNGIATVGTNLFLGALHDSPIVPDAAVGVYETSGLAPQHVHGSGIAWEQPTFQVVVRGSMTGYQAARQTAEDIYQLLDAVQNATISGCYYVDIRAMQAPFSMGPDSTGRPQLACNFLARKNPS